MTPAKSSAGQKRPHVAPRGEFSHIRDLTPDPKNRRKRTARNVGMIVDALQKVGASRSIVIDETGEVLAGNGVLEAAAEAGITKVRVVDADGSTIIAVRRTGLSAKQKRDLAIYDNRAAELAEWDTAQLAADLEAGEDLSAFFFEDELKALLAKNTTVVEGLTDPDSVPDPRPTDIALGDLFQLGDHRLLCGDCTDPNLVERLMGGQRAGLMNTDPPYGVAYGNEERPNPGVAKPRVANDALESQHLQRFLESAFGVAKAVALVESAAWYMWHAHLTQGYFAAAAAAAADVILHRQIIWVKPVLLLGRGQYHWKHEPCFMGWVDGHQPPDYGLGAGERTQTTVWEIGSVTHAERKQFNHSTPKPVDLFAIPIVKHLIKGEACYEPFAGTGPQFIASEQRGVSCYGLELEPQFCQVIIDRWEAFTGRTAIKVGELVTA